MTTPNVSRETIQTLAALSGLSLDDGELDALIPQIERHADSMAALDAIDLDDVEPALIFKPGGK